MLILNLYQFISKDWLLKADGSINRLFPVKTNWLYFAVKIAFGDRWNFYFILFILFFFVFFYRHKEHDEKFKTALTISNEIWKPILKVIRPNSFNQFRSIASASIHQS